MTFLASLPERVVRSLAALSGTLHETFELALPRLVRRSRALRGDGEEPPPRHDRARRRVGHVRRSRTSTSRPGQARREEGCRQRGRARLDSSVRLLAAHGCSPPRPTSHTDRGRTSTRSWPSSSVWACFPRDQDRARSTSCSRPWRVSSTSARLVDIPPLEVEGAAAVWTRSGGTRPRCRRRRSWRASSTACGRPRDASGPACSGVGRRRPRVLQLRPARGTPACWTRIERTLRPVATEGFGAYARRVSRPYADAVARHFDAESRTLTERGLERLRGSEGAR